MWAMKFKALTTLLTVLRKLFQPRVKLTLPLTEWNDVHTIPPFKHRSIDQLGK